MLMCAWKKLHFNAVSSVPAYGKKYALTAMSCEDSWSLDENAIITEGYLPREGPYAQILLGPFPCVSTFLCLIRNKPGSVAARAHVFLLQTSM